MGKWPFWYMLFNSAILAKRCGSITNWFRSDKLYIWSQGLEWATFRSSVGRNHVTCELGIDPPGTVILD